MPILVVIGVVIALTSYKKESLDFFKNTPKLASVNSIISNLSINEINRVKNQCIKIDEKEFSKSNDVESYLSNLNESQLKTILKDSTIQSDKYYESGFNLFQHKIPTYIFLIITLLLTFLSVTHNLSLIPMLGLVSCLYMMSELNVSNWIGFGVWLLVGLLVYFGYSKKHSKLNTSAVE
jgi:hypothetical protein